MAYFRIGRDHSRVKLLAGFNHQVQWGGRSSHETIDGRMPNGIKNYFRIVSGKPGDASSTPNSFDDGNRVGNHLGTPTTETIWAQPPYADFFTSNNRVSVYHLGVRGKLFRRMEWAGKCSYSSNWGTYNAPFKSSVRQFSAVLNLQTRVSIAGPTDIGASFGLDTGKLFPQTFGAMLTVRKQMSIY